MKTKWIISKTKNIRFIILCSLAGFLFSGCIYDPVYHGPPPYGRYHPHFHDYYYYPAARVYFHFATGFYFYFTNQRWVRVKVLPPHIHIDPFDRVRIVVDSDKPYTRHKEHRSHFKPRPTYRHEEKESRSVKEKEANRNWYRKYKKQPPKQRPDKQRKDKKDKRKY